MGWGDALFQGYEAAHEHARQSRLDQLREQYMRGMLALRSAALSRMEARDRMASEAYGAARERQGFSDRLRVLGRETAPFAPLVTRYPEAKASPFTGQAYSLDELLAREPAAAARPAYPDPVMVPGAEGPRVPTNTEARRGAIEGAYGAFGQAAEARMKKLLAMRAATARPQMPNTRALEQQSRQASALRQQAEYLEKGQQLMPNGFVTDITDPGKRAAAHQDAARLRARANAIEASVRTAYQQLGDLRVVSPAPTDPQAVHDRLAEEGLGDDEILRQMSKLFTEDELSLVE